MRYWQRVIVYFVIAALLSWAREGESWWRWVAYVLYFLLVGAGLVYVVDLYDKWQEKRKDNEFARKNDGNMIKVDGKRFATHGEATIYLLKKLDRRG